MKANKFIALLALIGVAFIQSCSRPENLPVERYRTWIANEENGLLKTKTVRNVRIMARYLPAEWLAYREFMNRPLGDTTSYDSIFSSYRCGMVFQVTLDADKNDKRYGSLFYYNLTSNNEVMTRTRALSFDIESFISAEYKDAGYYPVLSNFDGYDQLRNSVSFEVSFVIPDYQCGSTVPDFQDVKLSFFDPVWDLGTNHFNFDGESLSSVPSLTF